jgi:hypothetical protein
MIDLRKPYQWEETNDQLKERLQSPYQVRFYQTTQQALLETVIGFQNLYSHKRQFASHIGMGTHADEAMLFLSRQGIKNLELTNDLSNDEKKTIVHLLDLDDAITAEVYQEKYHLDDKLFRISVSHHLHFFKNSQPVVKDTEVLIWSLPEGAIAFHGKRCVSVPTLHAPTLQCTPLPSLPSSAKTENKAWVQQLESKSISGSQALKGLSNSRIYDRAILTWTDIEGEALRQTLIEDHTIAPDHLEALSLSRWNELKLIAQFEKRSWSPEQFRGTLILSAALSEDKNLTQKLETTIKKIRTQNHF